MNKIRSWLKKFLGINDLQNEVGGLSKSMASHRKFVADKVAELKEYTSVDADVGFRGNNTIILTGVYRNQAYVHFYDVGNAEFKHLVEMMKEMKGHALIRHIDKPPQFAGIFDI